MKEGIPSRLEKDCHTFQVLGETPPSVIARLTSSAEAISVGQEIATHLSGARNDTGVVPGERAIVVSSPLMGEDWGEGETGQNSLALLEQKC